MLISTRWSERSGSRMLPIVTRWDADSETKRSCAGRGVLGWRAAATAMIVLMIGALVEGAAIGTGGGTATWRSPAPAAWLADDPPRPGFRWPLAGHPTVVTPFRPPARPWLPGHRGVDLAATPGAIVVAAGDGTVRFAGVVAGVGVVSVDHANGLRTTYEPIRPSVRAGQQIGAGTTLGTLVPGHPGCPVPACLHWGLRRGDVYLNPLALLGLAPVRLLPLRPGTPA
jgi:murein DD-endopeptidase MepM/ murein hydrolase activator NlpD